MRLKGKVAIVTGSTQGIGRGIARRFAAEGADVVVVGRNETNGRAVVAELQGLGARAIYVRADLSRAEDAERMVERTLEAFGQIDVLVNNAGGSTVGRGTPFFELAIEDWQYTIDIDLTGTFLCARAAARNMVERKQGAIINIASVFSYATASGNASYTAAKGAVVQLTKAMAADLAPYQVRVNCIAPGAIVFEERHQVRGTSMGDYLLVERWGKAEDIAAAALFLATEESSYIDGQTITVDGGLLALMPGKPLGRS
jgi:3-oxoacyl-[acyl-carrier protein] reductase